MEDTDSPASWAPQSPDLSSYHSGIPDPDPTFVHPQHRAYRGSISSATSNPLYSPPGSSPVLQNRQAPLPIANTTNMPRGVKKEESMGEDAYMPDATENLPKTRGKKPAQSYAEVDSPDNTDNAASAPHSVSAAEEATGFPGASEIVIKNHFPVARIKRIMQADDDVGKVAQVTPVVVSKALELFMISLVTKSAAEAKNRNSKRVLPLHLKQVIVQNEQFDFLSDIVSKVAEPPQVGEKSGDGMDVDSKRKKAPAARKKKKVDEEEF